ncbi:UNVERIFIED_CONTAM: hypothetical protein PYX00_008477 [Menopon gallinae]|uniref:Aminopeptidase n=1 Tax=Menopon gallinae TaxID=328185 RepID=A0AAW2HPT9_9NEOP
MAGKKYRIQLRFRGVLSDSLTGFHRVAYRKRNAKKASWLASTVFEPNEARSAFPCFDEPSFKATFDIALAHDKKYTALSNMPVKTVTPVDGRSDYQWTIFERTPRMSTYLVAFLISDLHHFTPKLTPKEGVSNTTYRFWARQDVLHRTRYAAKIVPDMKNYLEELLGVPDVMPKYDFVALPSFISNALENWGLVSFAEKNILYTPGFSSVFSKFETTQILGHELSHIWFGNLVTPKYWDQIWLNEGFSNYFETLAADHVQPNWDVKTISLVFSYLKVFSLDAMHTSHPLVPQIKNLNDMNEIFDSISYQKGFFIVRMLNHTLGEETFMKGIRHYLSAHKLSNVDEDDLWDALTLYAHKDGVLPEGYHLKHIMESWTRRTGYPILDVFRDYDNQTAAVTQRRFLRPKFDLELRTNAFTDDDSEDTKWWIPLTYTSGKDLDFQNTKPKVWVKPTEEETVLTDMPEENQFVLMNVEASGLYRVNYDERNWELLIDFLLSENYSKISVINRVQIMDDLLDFARAGELSYTTAFEAAHYLKKEKNYLPWKAALSNFDYISRMFRSTDSNKLFKKFVRSLLSERFEELGIDPKKNESIMDAMNRKQIVKWACTTGHRQCTRRSQALFKKWTEEKKPDEINPIPSSIRGVVYCSAIANGGAKDWQFLWNRYLNNIEVSDKKAIINGLGCSRNTRTLRKYLDWSLNESSGIRKQDTVHVFKSVAGNDVGFNIAKEFLKTRMGDVKKYLGNNPFYISQMVESLASKMNQESHLQELEAMEEEHFSNLRSAPRSFKQAKERVTFNIDWLEQNYDPITDWLKKQKF